MASEGSKRLTTEDATKTYRYLRIGIVAAVVLLGSSVLIEHSKVTSGCWQTSISAYYYTPVRAIFVGALIAVGLSLIVIKGKNAFEDICLNFAGMLAPVVAIVPTTDVGECWSIEPRPGPLREDGSLAEWFLRNVENNFTALLWAGAVGLIAATVIALFFNRDLGIRGPIRRIDRGTLISLAVTTGLLVAATAAIRYWDGFYPGVETKIGPLEFSGVHGPAAILMFVFLIGAVGSRVFAHRHQWRTSWYFGLYFVVGLLMIASGIVFLGFGVGGDHKVGWVESFEIGFFALFWLIQTRENWDEGLPTSTRS